MANRSYSFKAVQLVVDGNLISGLGEGGVSFEVLSDVSETEAGLDGETVSSFIRDERILATITLQQQSRANALLWASYRVQKEAVENGVERPPMPFLLVDPINGDTIADAKAVFEGVPAPSKDRQAGMNEWRILLPQARAQLVLAAARL